MPAEYALASAPVIPVVRSRSPRCHVESPSGGDRPRPLPAFEQQRHDVDVVVHHRHVDRPHLVKRVLDVDVGAAGELEFDDLNMPSVGSEGQRGRAVSRLRVTSAPLSSAAVTRPVSPARAAAHSSSQSAPRLLSCGCLWCVPPGINASDQRKIVIGNIKAAPQRIVRVVRRSRSEKCSEIAATRRRPIGARICSHHASLALGAQDLVRDCPPRIGPRTSLLTRNDWAGCPAWPGRSNAATQRRRAAMRGSGGRGL